MGSDGGGDGDGSDDDGGVGEWSETVEDLVDLGDFDGSICDVELVASGLKIDDPPPPADDLRLATVLRDLADIHSSRGHSLEANKLRSQALFYIARAVNPSPQTSGGLDREKLTVKNSEREESSVLAASYNQEEDRLAANEVLPSIADRLAANEVLPSSASAREKGPGDLKQRGQGSILERKSHLYNNQRNVGTSKADARKHRADDTMDKVRNSRYGTSHILVLYDIPRNTRAMDVDKLFESFEDSGVVIRWVSAIVAIAVFSTPSAAREAQHTIECPFKVRPLGEDDALLSLLHPAALDPPCARPKA